MTTAFHKTSILGSGWSVMSQSELLQVWVFANWGANLLFTCDLIVRGCSTEARDGKMKVDLQSSLSSYEHTDKETRTLSLFLSLPSHTHLHPPSPSRSDTGRTLPSPLLSHMCLCGRRSADAGVSVCIIGSPISAAGSRSSSRIPQPGSRSDTASVIQPKLRPPILHTGGHHRSGRCVFRHQMVVVAYKQERWTLYWSDPAGCGFDHQSNKPIAALCAAAPELGAHTSSAHTNILSRSHLAPTHTHACRYVYIHQSDTL